MGSIIQERTMEIFNQTLCYKKDLIYSGEVAEINHFNMLTKAGINDSLYKLMGCNMCMLNCKYEEKPGILIIFSIPINETTGSKLIADRVMEIIENMEECFTTIDYMQSKEQKDEKFIYVTIIKIIGEEYAKKACKMDS